MAYLKPGTSTASPAADCYGQTHTGTSTLGNSGDTWHHWADQTGNGHDLTQTNVGAVPIVCDGPNDGSAGVLGSNGGIFIPLGCTGLASFGAGLSADPGAFTIFFVWEPMAVATNNVSGNSQFSKCLVSSATANGHALQLLTSLPKAGATYSVLGGANKGFDTPKIWPVNRQVMSYRTNGNVGNGQTLWLNGVLQATAGNDFTNGASSCNNITVMGNSDGAGGGQKQPEGKLIRIVVYTSVLTDTEMLSVSNALISQHSVTTNFTSQLVLPGDSKTFGQNSTRGLNISRFIVNANPHMRVFNVGTPSQQTTDLDADYSNLVTPLKDPTMLNLLGLREGYNDTWIGSRTAAQIWASLASIVAKAKADGFIVILCTLDGALGSVSSATIDAVNTQIRTNAPTNTNIAALARFDLNSYLGLTPATTSDLSKDATYYESGGVHETSIGYAVGASILLPLITAPYGIPLAANVKSTAPLFGPDANGLSTGTASSGGGIGQTNSIGGVLSQV